ncbi:MAG TPA: DUF1786 family protein, partial [Ktedonobacterales bacterium]
MTHVELRDFDGRALRRTFARFGIDPAVDVVAVAAFDHGAAPPGYSDRRFRFDYLRRAVTSRPQPSAFAYRDADVPSEMTRLAAVAADAAEYMSAVPDGQRPVIMVMDTASAAVTGAQDDALVRAARDVVIANIGNFHTLAFHLYDGRIQGLFEHHTGELSRDKLEGYLQQLVAGTLSNATVFEDNGHGALLLDHADADDVRQAAADTEMPLLAITGPRREMLRGSALHPYEAVPHGAMMLAGCFGLLRAAAVCCPELAPAITDVLGPLDAH